jgi:hypothetical protein
MFHDDGALVAVAMNGLAREHLVETRTSVTHVIGHHHEHLERRCGCRYGWLGMTVMGTALDDVVLVVDGPSGDGSYAILGLTRSELAAL